MNQEYYSIKTHLTSFTIICRATMHHYTKPCSLGQTLTAWSVSNPFDRGADYGFNQRS